MSQKRKQLNRDDIASQISHMTGYTKKDVEEVLEAEALIYESAIEQGYDIKNHKLFKMELDKRDERIAWNGLEKKHFTIPEKHVVRFKPLIRIQEALDKLNSKELPSDTN